MRNLILFIIVNCVIACNLYDEKPIKLAEYDLGDDYPKIYLYKSLSNATTTESIQIRTELDLNNAKIVFEKYDILLKHEVLSDTLKLIVQDTSSYDLITDTIYVDINELR